MCDYSLHGVKNRLAEEGERLTVHKFFTGSKGLAAPAQLTSLQQATAAGQGWWERLKALFTDNAPHVAQDLRRGVTAVCIPPGAQLELQGLPPQMQRQYGVGPREYVTFVQLDVEAFRYRDAFRFDNGREVLLQHLSEGASVEVLQLSLTEDMELEREPSMVETQSVYAAGSDWTAVHQQCR